jgi:putative component of membrane protein insertase Oxa1/YidC/SpoIIIJ protein YidD
MLLHDAIGPGDDQIDLGRHIYGIYNRVCKCVPWNATGPQFIPSSLLLHLE